MNASSGEVNRASILVVDDAPANLRVLAEMLKERGHIVRPVPSGKLALRAAQHDPPDLILLDIDMPDMDGYEVCRRLKADKRLSEVPVVFISGLTETMDKVKAFSVGGADYVTKPFQLEEVQARVETHLQLRRKQRELQVSYQQLRELEALRRQLTTEPKAIATHNLTQELFGAAGHGTRDEYDSFLDWLRFSE